MPFVTWDLNPVLPAAGTRTCDTLAPCVTSAPVRIPYTIRDDYGNSSAGIITVDPWNAVVPSGNITYTGNQILVNGASIPLGAPISAHVTGIQAGSATIQVGDDAAVNIATPSTSGLVQGEAVTTV